MRIDLLDHGYALLVERWGSDEQIIESARMSTGKGFLGWTHYRQCRYCDKVHHVDVAGTPSNPGGCPIELDGGRIAVGMHDWRDVPKGDAGLLRFLWENKHSTPFEMGGLTVEVQAPIMTFREWQRHRVPFGYSELSARYTPLPDVNYLPSVERCMTSSTTNKQAGTAKGAEALTNETAEAWLNELVAAYEHSERVYQLGLVLGVPKELARLSVPVGRYSRMRATGNLRGWLAFLTLRMAKDAQYEIRVFAEAVGQMVASEFPQTWELFSEGAKK